jgi:hypothetical protein
MESNIDYLCSVDASRSCQYLPVKKTNSVDQEGVPRNQSDNYGPGGPNFLKNHMVLCHLLVN